MSIHFRSVSLRLVVVLRFFPPLQGDDRTSNQALPRSHTKENNTIVPALASRQLTAVKITGNAVKCKIDSSQQLKTKKQTRTRAEKGGEGKNASRRHCIHMSSLLLLHIHIAIPVIVSHSRQSKKKEYQILSHFSISILNLRERINHSEPPAAMTAAGCILHERARSLSPLLFMRMEKLRSHRTAPAYTFPNLTERAPHTAQQRQKLKKPLQNPLTLSTRYRADTALPFLFIRRKQQRN